jgi:hypothetical protein
MPELKDLTPEPPVKLPPVKVTKNPPVAVTPLGPDLQTAAPVEGSTTVMTSAGELDFATVYNNRVGGVGVVHMLHDPTAPKPATPTGEGQASRERETAKK